MAKQPEQPGGDIGGRGAASLRSRRERILAAAINAFASGGFQGVSTRQIAEAAGVTDPLLFYHFKSKADLYLAAVQDQLEKFGEGLDLALRGIDGPMDQLRVYVEVYLAYFLDLEPGLTVTLRELYGLPQPVETAIRSTYAATAGDRLEAILDRAVQQRLVRAINVPACATAIVGILHIFIRTSARSPRFSRDEVVAQVLEHYVPGILAAPSTPRAMDHRDHAAPAE
jgi:AcrR family transcriptional regulator